ncbi:hypothetical protein [Aeromonas jandaei]|uniref:hypothetical protein n=1 Tax=Aeromonas jandaei TaxID=650 RepID=UPI003B9F8826
MLLRISFFLITVGCSCHASAVLEASLTKVVLGHKPVLNYIMIPEVLESNSEVTISFDSQDKDKDDAISYDVTYVISKDGKEKEYYAQSDGNKLTIKIPDRSYDGFLSINATPRNSPDKRPYLGDVVKYTKSILGAISPPLTQDPEGRYYGDNSHISEYLYGKAISYCERNGMRLASDEEFQKRIFPKYGRTVTELINNGFIKYVVTKQKGKKPPALGSVRFVVASKNTDAFYHVFIDVNNSGYQVVGIPAVSSDNYGNAYVCVH